MMIHTAEPISIEITEDFTSETLGIWVDTTYYATLRHIDLEELSESKVRHWVEETYYDGAYLTDAYIAPDMDGREFKMARCL